MFQQLAVESGLFINCREHSGPRVGNSLIFLGKLTRAKFLEEAHAPMHRGARLYRDGKQGDGPAFAAVTFRCDLEVNQTSRGAVVKDLVEQVLVGLRRD